MTDSQGNISKSLDYLKHLNDKNASKPKPPKEERLPKIKLKRDIVKREKVEDSRKNTEKKARVGLERLAMQCMRDRLESSESEAH